MRESGRLFSHRHVAGLLGVPLRELTWWAFASPPRMRYRRFEIQRRNGGERTIHAPIKPLKDIQRSLASELTRRYEAPHQVHGFVPGRSPLSNALVHKNREWVLRVDLADFFPSINFGRVRGLFMSYPFEFGPPAATLLAQICCFDGSLPQGAPTSPVISNFICHSLDKDLARLAARERCSVSRYADDLCFSSDQAYFPNQLAYVDLDKTIAGQAMEAVVEENGFAINPEKTRLMRRTQRQRVTGLVVNEGANPSRDYVRNLRNILYIWERHGEADATAAWGRKGNPRNWPPGKPAPGFARVIRGRVQHVGSVKGWTNPVYLRLAKTLERVDPEFVLRHEAPPPVPADRRRVRLFAEGETDVVHMLAAQRRFHREKRFLDLELVTDGESAQNGDQKLLRACTSLAMTPQPVPCVCLFDRDNDTVLKKAIGSGDWKDCGNGVVAVALVDPGAERACVETLYDESVREIEDEDGRRLFLMSEFDERSGLHRSRLFSTPHPDHRRLVPESVFSVEDGRSVGLTKVDFAAAIDAESSGFANVSFDPFAPTFEAIREAVAAAAPVQSSD